MASSENDSVHVWARLCLFMFRSLLQFSRNPDKVKSTLREIQFAIERLLTE